MLQEIIRFLIYIAGCTLCGACGAYFFKLGVDKLEKINVLRMMLIPQLYIGAIFYFSGAVINIVALKYFEYTIVLPATSFTYVWSMVISYFILKEKVSKQKIIGLILIIIGAFTLVLSI